MIGVSCTTHMSCRSIFFDHWRKATADTNGIQNKEMGCQQIFRVSTFSVIAATATTYILHAAFYFGLAVRTFTIAIWDDALFQPKSHTKKRPRQKTKKMASKSKESCTSTSICTSLNCRFQSTTAMENLWVVPKLLCDEECQALQEQALAAGLLGEDGNSARRDERYRTTRSVIVRDPDLTRPGADRNCHFRSRRRPQRCRH
jgi:hypothetical protein